MTSLRPNYQRSKADWSKTKNKVKSCRQKLKRQFPSDGISGQLENCLYNIIELCNKNNTVLIGVKFPISKDYINIINNKTYNADEILATKDIDIINMKRIFIKYDEYFRDEDHLNDRGSDKFTEMLNKVLKHYKSKS
jgi:hypothetical protein